MTSKKHFEAETESKTVGKLLAATGCAACCILRDTKPGKLAKTFDFFYNVNQGTTEHSCFYSQNLGLRKQVFVLSTFPTIF